MATKTKKFVFKPQYEKHDPTVLTIPNDAYKIRDLLVKFSNGVLPQNYQTGNTVYNNGDLDSPDMEKLQREDMVDKNNYLQSTIKRIEDLKKKHELIHAQIKTQTDQLNKTNDDE